DPRRDPEGRDADHARPWRVRADRRAHDPRSDDPDSGSQEVVSTSRVDKPWGHELIWARTDRYVGKILHVKAGEALSLQYHRVKDETIMLLSGRMQLIHFGEGEDPRSHELVPNEPFHI